MQRALFTEDELKKASERRLKYQGVARVKISDIHFTDSQRDYVDQKNIDRLCNIFRKARCQRFELANYVPAIVSRQALSEAIQNAGISARSLIQSSGVDIPTLSFPGGQLTGLHGRHRLYAGAKVLAPNERWWTVDIYLDDLSEELKTSISEEYSSEKQLTDGEIYRKIRQYESDGNRILRQKWVMRLSSDWKRKRLEQLGKEKNEQLRDGFDKLLAIPGLWLHGMRISMLHRVIALVSTEEILTYLDHIYDTYHFFVGNNQRALRLIETESVLKLQLKAPGNCDKDAKELMGLIFSGQIFSSFGESERKEIWERIKRFDGIIPSLETFWDDFIFFEQCAQCMRWLFGVTSTSIWNTMKGCFLADSGEKLSSIQISESSFHQEPGNDSDRLDMGYRQLWLYTMRHYNSMPLPAKCEDELLVKRERGELDQSVIFNFAELAQSLGFRSKTIDNLLQRSPDRLIARHALLQARKPEYFKYEPTQFESLIDRISACFSQAVEYNRPTSELLADSEVQPRKRCGFPQEKAHAQDAPHLFLDQVHAEAAFAPVTTYYVRRCFYYAFLGKRSLPKQGAGRSGPSVPPRENSPLFVDENEPSQFAPHTHTIDSMPDIGSGQARPLYENFKTRRALEGHNSPNIEDRKHGERNYFLEPDRLCEKSPEDDIMASQSSEAFESEPEEEAFGQVGEHEPNASPTNPLLNRQELRSSPSDTSHKSDYLAGGSDQPSTPDESDSSHESSSAHKSASPRESLKSGSPTPAQVYSPSVYSTRGRSSVRESEARQNFSENIARSMQERERIDEDWERERLEQEYGLPYSGDVPEENFKSCEDRHTEEQEISSSNLDIDETRIAIEAEHNPSRQDHRVTRFDLGGSAPVQAGEGDVSAQALVPSDNAQSSETREQIDFKFWSYLNDDWSLSDHYRVDPADPFIVERIATKYMRKGFSIYDKSLNSLSPQMCFRAGIADATNAVFVISRETEAKLVKEDRFKMHGINKTIQEREEIRRVEKPKRSKRIRLRSESL